MKHNWEYKKLVDVCRIQYGFAFDSALFNEDGEGLPLVRIRDVVRGFSETHFKGVYAKDYLVRSGDYLIGMDGEFNIAQWKSEDALLNQRVCRIEVKAVEKVAMRFLYYFLSMHLKEIENETPFVTVKHLSAKRINQIAAPVPPLPVQEQIVSELDKVSEIIKKKRQQVKELDNLAQSLFYEMFGDPITNEKGWEVCKWIDCLVIYNGRNQKQVEDENGGYPICGSGGVLGRATDYITPEQSVIIGRKGNINRPIYMYEKFWNVDTAFGIHPKHNLNARYLYYYCVVFDFERLNKAVTIPSLLKSDLLEIEMPLPPLPLQQSFSEKAEAIERQKGLIGQSIGESQTLFDARMEHWFGE